MIRRRRAPRYSELTSLLDVLFILLFASLIQAAGVVRAAKRDSAKEAAREVAEAEASVSDSRPTIAAPSPQELDREKLHRRALTELSESMREREVLYARVSGHGILTAFERDIGGQLQTLEIGAPLLASVPDPDIGIEYIAARDPALRLCTRARVTLGLPDLDDRLIVIAVELPLAQLEVALVEGLRADVQQCFTDERGVAVLVPPEA